MLPLELLREGFLDRSLKVSLAVLSLTALACAGFAWGRALGARSRPRHESRGLSAMLPFHPRFAGGFNEPEPNPRIPPDQIFEDVLDKVQQYYVDGGGSGARLSNGALTRMLASLDDPRTSFLDPVYREARQDALKGRYHGIGAVLSVLRTKKSGVEYRQLTVVAVMPGSPAEHAGLRSRDVITHVDDRWIITYSMSVESDRIATRTADEDERALQMKDVGKRFKQGISLTKALGVLATGESKTLKVTFLRPAQSTPTSVSIKTGLTEVQPVEYRVLAGRVGYLRVRQFNARATHEFQQALDGAAAPSARLRGLIVDLRDNPGGVRADSSAEVDGFLSARKLMARLTRGGAVATVERRPNIREPLNIMGAKPAITVPRIVLVDQGTANLSEMVAAALRDSGARVMGVHTFGDDVLPLFTVFKSGGGVEMTSAHLLTTGGVDLSRGIEPDLPIGPAAVSSDAAVKIALAKLGA
jgi:carboxyl-terminal processing protease